MRMIIKSYRYGQDQMVPRVAPRVVPTADGARAQPSSVSGHLPYFAFHFFIKNFHGVVLKSDVSCCLEFTTGILRKKCCGGPIARGAGASVDGELCPRGSRVR